jgi:hypothetical protein
MARRSVRTSERQVGIDPKSEGPGRFIVPALFLDTKDSCIVFDESSKKILDEHVSACLVATVRLQF